MYTLKILNHDDFDTLPYKNAKSSLGLADAKTGVAFVRDTGYNDITKATISHELDELVNKTSPHEEDGIRYKSLASFGAGAGAGALANLLPGKLGKFTKSISPLLSAGAGALANQKGQPFKGALQGFTGGGAGSALLGGGQAAIQGLRQPGGTFGKAFSNFGTGAKDAGLGYAGAIPGFGGVGTDQPTGKLAQWLQGTGAAGGGGKYQGGSSGGSAVGTSATELAGVDSPLQAATQAATQAAPIDAGGGGIFDQFKKSLPGLATTQIGNLFAPEVQVPDIGGIGSDLQSQLQAGTLGDPVAKGLGMDELSRVLGEDIGAVPSNAFDLGDTNNEEAKQKALSNYVNQWKGIRPGADFSNDPEFVRGYNDIQKQYDDQRTMQRDQQQFQYNQQQLAQKYNYMVQALGIDQSQMQQYVNLAQLEINQLMLEYGLSVGEAQQFKQLFGDLGQIMMSGQGQGGDVLSQFGLGGQQ